MTEENNTPVEETKETPKMYYGAHEIVNVEDEDGNKRVEVKFAEPIKYEDGSEDVGEKFTIPEWELNACTSNAPCPAQIHLSELRNRRANYVVAKLIEILEQHDIRVEEVGFYQTKLIESMSQAEDEACLRALGATQKDEVRISHWAKFLGK